MMSKEIEEYVAYSFKKFLLPGSNASKVLGCSFPAIMEGLYQPVNKYIKHEEALQPQVCSTHTYKSIKYEICQPRITKWEDMEVEGTSSKANNKDINEYSCCAHY